MRAALTVLGWIVGRIPTLLIWAALIGLFWFGASHGWKFGTPEPEEASAAEHPVDDDDSDFVPRYVPQPYDVPILMTHDPEHCKCGQRPVMLASPDAARKAALKTAPVQYDRVTLTIAAHGQVVQDPAAVGKITPRLGGVLVQLTKDIGQPVRRGECVGLLEAPEVGRAKLAYLSARVQLESKEKLLQSLESGMAPSGSLIPARAALREAQAHLAAARQDVVNLGLPVLSTEDERLPDDAFLERTRLLGIPFTLRLALYARAEASGSMPSSSLLPLTSPLDGVVVRRAGVVGESVAALHPVYDIVDPTRVHVELDVRQEDLPRIAVGQSAVFATDGSANPPGVAGVIDWISPAVDERTRTVRARMRVPNPGGTLKTGTFGRGDITVEPLRIAPVVPRAAVHWEGCKHIVFVKRSEMEYIPRAVTLGIRDGDRVEIVNGLEVGDEIVVVGSHVLKSELFKDRIGGDDE